MLSATLERGLRTYAIGDKLRSLRLSKKMGLVELGRHTGLSAALLSKIERGRLFPTLPTLLRVALVFGVGLEFFIANDSKRNAVAIVRRGERQRFPERPGGKDVSFFFESLDFTGVERVAGGELGRGRRAAPQRLGPSDEAAHRDAAPLELGQQPSAHVTRGAGQQDAPSRHGTDTTRPEHGLPPTLR